VSNSLSLFSPFTLRDATFRNRSFVSPMCQYSAKGDGVPHDWHFVHLGQFAVGGAGLVMTEATAVAPEGRLSFGDTGLWNDDQASAWKRINRFIRDQGALSGVQLVHAGRKGSTTPPWEGEIHMPVEIGGWETVGPSEIAFGALPVPRALDEDGIRSVVADFRDAARRALEADFDVIELHAAHGYLVHQFLSPISNARVDSYGGTLDGRVKFLLEVVDAIREVWPDSRPLFVRVSATDWVDGGWNLDDTVAASVLLREHGVDLVDCSSGGTVDNALIPKGPGYQVPFARAIKQRSGIATGAVGFITDPRQANEIIAEEWADAVFLGRELLRQPRWPLLAAVELSESFEWPVQYKTSQPRRSSETD
jgi:2,4-dienoyl-CoA reductase-like NADH-dependent reductase (Old Yellow Enzyme family)